MRSLRLAKLPNSELTVTAYYLTIKAHLIVGLFLLFTPRPRLKLTIVSLTAQPPFCSSRLGSRSWLFSFSLLPSLNSSFSDEYQRCKQPDE